MSASAGSLSGVGREEMEVLFPWVGICKTLHLLLSPEFHGGEVTLKLCQVSLNHGSSIFKQVDHHDDVVWVIFLQYTYLPSIAESCSLY